MIYSSLFKIVRINILLQCLFVILAIILISSQGPSMSNSTAVSVGYLAIFISFFPILYFIFNRQFSSIFSCIVVYNIAPIWFLYLEGIFDGYDAYIYITPEYRVYSYLWSSIFQLFVNFFYLTFRIPVLKRSISFFKFLVEVRFKSSAFIYVTLLSFLIPLIVLAFYYGSIFILYDALTQGRAGGGGSGILKRDTVGGTSSFLLPITWLWQLVPLFASIGYIEGKKYSKFLSFLSLSLGVLVVFITFLGGSRGTMIMVSAPALFYLFFYNWDK